MEISLKGFYLFEGLYVELGVSNDRIAPFDSTSFWTFKKSNDLRSGCGP